MKVIALQQDSVQVVQRGLSKLMSFLVRAMAKPSTASLDFHVKICWRRLYASKLRVGEEWWVGHINFGTWLGELHSPVQPTTAQTLWRGKFERKKSRNSSPEKINWNDIVISTKTSPFRRGSRQLEGLKQFVPPPNAAQPPASYSSRHTSVHEADFASSRGCVRP